LIELAIAEARWQFECPGEDAWRLYKRLTMRNSRLDA
jgi:hypothetical protein